MRSFVIKEKYNNSKILNVIKKEFPKVNILSLNKAFRKKDIKVNNTHVDKDYIVHTGDEIKVYIIDNILYSLPEKIFYAYEDDNILVAYKPKGIETTPFENLRTANTIYFDDLVKKEKGENITVCHRLDVNTEGLVIFTKSSIAHEIMLSAFKENLISKTYLCLVYGKLPKKQDIISNYIVTNNGFSKVTDVKSKNSKECITEYFEYEYLRKKNVTIVSVLLHTGRTHQIRAFMKYLKTPVIGDPKYSTNEINNKFNLYTQVLFASKYTFNFPKGNKLEYLNNITIDCSKDVLDKIYSLIK